MKKTKVALVFATAVLGLASCKSKPEFKNIDGLEYMIVKDAEGTKKPAEGDFPCQTRSQVSAPVTALTFC